MSLHCGQVSTDFQGQQKPPISPFTEGICDGHCSTSARSCDTAKCVKPGTVAILVGNKVILGEILRNCYRKIMCGMFWNTIYYIQGLIHRFALYWYILYNHTLVSHFVSIS